MSISEKCNTNNTVLFLCAFRIVNIKLSFELSSQSFSQILFKEHFFFIMSSIAQQTLSIFMLIIEYFKSFRRFIMSERSLYKRNILILSKFNFIFKSTNRIEFNHIHVALNEFIKFLSQIFCIFYKV